MKFYTVFLRVGMEISAVLIAGFGIAIAAFALLKRNLSKKIS